MEPLTLLTVLAAALAAAVVARLASQTVLRGNRPPVFEGVPFVGGVLAFAKVRESEREREWRPFCARGEGEGRRPGGGGGGRRRIVGVRGADGDGRGEGGRTGAAASVVTAEAVTLRPGRCGERGPGRPGSGGPGRAGRRATSDGQRPTTAGGRASPRVARSLLTPSPPTPPPFPGPKNLMKEAYATKGEVFTVPVLHK
jgi:hypothetical protein